MFSSCGDDNTQKKKAVSTETKNNNSTAPQENKFPGLTNKAVKVDPKKASGKSSLTPEQIDSLYENPTIVINGLDRFVNSLTAMEYIRGMENMKIMRKYLLADQESKDFLTDKDNVVILVPSNEYLEQAGKSAVPQEILGASADLKKKARYNHMFLHVGKYTGGDFITIENVVNQRQNRIEKKEDGWYFKSTKLGEPALVRNGIVFSMEGDNFPQLP